MTFTRPPDDLDRDLVFEFFWRFSSFECALKREGFLTVGGNDAAQPDWKRFGREIDGRFADLNVAGFHSAVRQLTVLSPRRQIVRDGELSWEPVTRGSQGIESFVLRLLRTARNNLFHGGKYPDGPIEEVARDRDILAAAILVLKGCYELHPGIKARLDAA